MTINPHPWDINPYGKTKENSEGKTVDANQNDSVLFFWVPSGSYFFSVNIDIAAGTDIKCGLSYPGGALLNTRSQALRIDATSGLLVYDTIAANTVNDIDADSAFSWWGVVHPATAGDGDNLSFQWSRNTAAGTSTVNSGWFELRRIT